MQELRQFRVASANVIRETFEDESVIVNLDTGAYYSLQGTAAAIWTLVEQGHSETALRRAIATQYAGDATSIEAACSEFLDRLLEERLIALATSSQSAEPVPALNPAGGRPEFTTPSIAKFSDMQELLLLDPIHETDETGWPARKQ